jgi:hypothetical protein
VEEHEMKKISWGKLRSAITQGDGDALRTLAGKARNQEQRNLLRLLADMVSSGLSTGGTDSEELPPLVAKLVYDTAHQPLPAGMRAERAVGRQALYCAGPYSVDLRVEHERGSGRVCLVGQIADRRQPQRSIGDVPVLLMSGKAVVERAFSNMFGEFQMECAPSRHLRLCFPVEQRVDLRLSDLIPGKG